MFPLSSLKQNNTLKAPTVQSRNNLKTGFKKILSPPVKAFSLKLNSVKSQKVSFSRNIHGDTFEKTIPVKENDSPEEFSFLDWYVSGIEPGDRYF